MGHIRQSELIFAQNVRELAFCLLKEKIELFFKNQKLTSTWLRSTNRYYESKGHQKRIIQSGGISDIRRNIQDVVGTKVNINIGPMAENYGGETFLSEEVAISLLQETKQAFKRCQMVSYPHT